MQELADRLRTATGAKEEAEARDFVIRNFEAIMEADIPEEDKDFLTELAEDMGEDITDYVSEYEAAYNGYDPDDLLSMAEMIDRRDVDEQI